MWMYEMKNIIINNHDNNGKICMKWMFVYISSPWRFHRKNKEKKQITKIVLFFAISFFVFWRPTLSKNQEVESHIFRFQKIRSINRNYLEINAHKTHKNGKMKRKTLIITATGKKVTKSVVCFVTIIWLIWKDEPWLNVIYGFCFFFCFCLPLFL